MTSFLFENPKQMLRFFVISKWILENYLPYGQVKGDRMKCFFKVILLTLAFSVTANAATETPKNDLYWMKIKATNRFERSYIANLGVSIEGTEADYVIGLGPKRIFDKVQSSGRLITGFQYNITPLDFPKKDDQFHNYAELTTELQALAAQYPNFVQLGSIGKSVEGRDIWAMRITENVGEHVGDRPAIIFMGGHHAREHISIEMPLMLAQHLLSKMAAQDAQIMKLLASREIHIIPVVNPDGAEFDVASGSYQMWRKNRRNNGDGTTGVDLNRNYGFGWGTGGSSTDGDSDVFMGPKPFSEPETQAVKAYVEAHNNISILLSFHTFSELILYPWGHTYDSIGVAQDKAVHETMARQMAKWNGYTPEQSSDLYIASGDTTDWSYGEHKIISFTFELDPKNIWSGGFYPGQGKIPIVFNKNLQPCLYMMDLADNPYRVLQPQLARYGMQTNWMQ